MRTEEKDNGILEHWMPEEVHEAHSKGEIVLIDVRTPQEYGFEHIEGALLAPRAFVGAGHMPSQEGKRIVFHCGSGGRSSSAGEAMLAEHGGRIAHMEGGFKAWKAAKLPYITTDMGTGAPKRAGS